MASDGAHLQAAEKRQLTCLFWGFLQLQETFHEFDKMAKSRAKSNSQEKKRKERERREQQRKEKKRKPVSGNVNFVSGVLWRQT